MVSNLMISAKLATPGFLKTKVFWNKDLSCESNYIVDVVMWSKVGNYHFYEKSYHNLNFISIWPEKSIFLRSALGSSSIIWVWHEVWPWNFTPMSQKG